MTKRLSKKTVKKVMAKSKKKGFHPFPGEKGRKK